MLCRAFIPWGGEGGEGEKGHKVGGTGASHAKDGATGTNPVPMRLKPVKTVP